MRALPGEVSRQPEGPKPPSRGEAAAEQQRRILATATMLFAKRGFHHTTVELIVRRAGVGYATFYRNFADKEECFLEVLGAASSAAMERTNAAFSEQSGNWVDKIVAAVRGFFEQLAAEPAAARVFVVESLTAGPASVARYESALRSLEPLLMGGRELSPRSIELPDTLEGTLAGGVLWIAYQRLILGEADQLATLLPETIEFVLTPYVGEEQAVRAVHSAGLAPDPERALSSPPGS
jgi:AcrR family transcriptional regulator